jgi:GH18 family chitinase
LFINYSGQININKLSNIAFGFNDQVSAKKLIALILADEIKEARKKAREQAELSPEALLEKDNRRKAAAAASKATRERRKAEKAAQNNTSSGFNEVVDFCMFMSDDNFLFM